MTAGYRSLLDCPACGEPCAEIPPCEGGGHLGCQAESPVTPSWCEERAGVCACGARLHVVVDDGRAWLEEEEEDDDG